MATDEGEFLCGGLTHYPQAATAVGQFKESIYAHLEKALVHHWSNDGKRPGRSDNVGQETYIESSRRVTLKTGEAATVAVGVGWDSKGSYLYVYCQDGPEWARHPKGPEFERHQQYTYFFQTCDPNDFAIDRDLHLILNRFETALDPPGPAVPAHRDATII